MSDTKTKSKHPVQPTESDDRGVLRFKENKIVRKLLDENSSIDMNTIAMWEDVSKEDRVQFAQLIGYSLSGFGDLSYVSDDDYYVADTMHDKEVDEKDAKIEYLEGLVKSLRDSLREPIASLFGVHPDDLKG